jgi:hypothetical protein
VTGSKQPRPDLPGTLPNLKNSGGNFNGIDCPKDPGFMA